MVVKIFILMFFYQSKACKGIRGHDYTVVKELSRLDVRKYPFSQRKLNSLHFLLIMIMIVGLVLIMLNNRIY